MTPHHPFYVATTQLAHNVTTVEIGDVRLMGPAEIADRLSVSRQRVYILTNRYDFPRPRWELAMGKIWWNRDVEAWIREHRPDLAEGVEGE
jgi:prophage regulatory protein